MTLKAGFAEADITPPVGTRKIGWIKTLIGEVVLDPLFSRVAAFENGGDKVGFVQLDTLSVRWTTTNEIRKRIESEFEFPGANVMVSATHNHAGPAVANVGEVERDDAYVAILIDKCVAAFGQALNDMTECEIGFNHQAEFNVSGIRRTLTRDGRAVTFGGFSDPNSLCLESVIDPEAAVLAVKNKRTGDFLGALFNFACHPVHHGGTNELSAGFPGLLCRKMKSLGIPVTVYLNGAWGDTMPGDLTRPGRNVSMEDAAETLFERVKSILADMSFETDAPLGSTSETIQLPYRNYTEEDVKGTAFGAQRFIDPALYDKAMPALLERIKTRKTQPAEVQVIQIGNQHFAGIPAEYFTAFGLRIKRESHPKHALIVGGANGMVGYVPIKEAFARGGYEATFGFGYRQAPEAGDMLADKAMDLIEEFKKSDESNELNARS